MRAVSLVLSDSGTLWTLACQAALSVEFSRQEYWSELLCPLPGDLPDAGIKPMSLVFPALEVSSLSLGAPGKPSCPRSTSQRTHFKTLL